MKTVYVRIDANEEYDDVDNEIIIADYCGKVNAMPEHCSDATEIVEKTRKIAKGLLEIAQRYELEIERLKDVVGEVDNALICELLEAIAETGIISEAENLLERNPE
jgi:hypothetical protein